jgi:AcrR family transcriptional regulator
MARPRKNEGEGPGTLERIVSAAADVFLRQGYGAAGMRQIAARAGIRESSLYHHVENKERLFALIIERAARRLETALPEMAQIEAGLARFGLRGFLHRGIGRFFERLGEPGVAEAARLIIAEAGRCQAAAHALQAFLEQPAQAVRLILGRAAARGQLAPSRYTLQLDALARLYQGAFFARVVTCLVAEAPDCAACEGEAVILCDAFCDLLAAPGGTEAQAAATRRDGL